MRIAIYETAVSFRDGRRLYVVIPADKTVEVIPEDVRQAWKRLKKVREADLGGPEDASQGELAGLYASPEERAQSRRNLEEKGYDARPAALA